MDSSGLIRIFILFAALLVSAGCSSTSAPKTEATTRTSFEPGVMPPAEGAPATAPAVAAATDAAQAAAQTAAAPVAATPDANSASAPQPMETIPPLGNVAAVDPVPGTTALPQDAVGRMQKRLDELETQVTALTQKVNAPPAAKRYAAIPHPAEDIGDNIEPAPVKRDPEAGFVNDAAVRAYRGSMILFLSRKYADAVLSFSQFLENFADHPLAGSAQFYVGECYFQQKEYRLAAQEYSRVLTAYERSAHVTTALRQLATSQDQLQLADEATRTRQTLSSLFPQSPASEPAYAAAAPGAEPAADIAAPAVAGAGTEATAPASAAAPAPGAAPAEVLGERAEAPAPATAEPAKPADGAPATDTATQ